MTDLQLGDLYNCPYPVRIYEQVLPISDFSIIPELTPFVVLEVDETHCVTWLKVISATGLVGYVQHNRHLEALTKMNEIVVGGLYRCRLHKELWMKVEKLLPSAASSSVFLGYLPANTPFVILEQRMSLPRKGYKELKILSTNGEIGWVFGYPSQFEELTDG